MAVKRAYQNSETLTKLLDALRRGATREQAARTIGASLVKLVDWIDKDEAFERAVLAAEAEAKRGGSSQVQASLAPKKDDKTGADRWKGLRGDAAKLGDGLLGFLFAIEARFAARPGAHGFSPFWRETLSAYYVSGKPTLLACVGRGGGKSDTQTAVVVTECLFAPRSVPPGETWIWPYLSKDMPEANNKVGPLEAALAAVGLGNSDLKIHRRKDGRSEVGFEDANGNAIEVRVYPNTKDALRGPTLCGATDDEEAFWRADRDLGTSTADDVLDAMAGAFRGDAKEKKHLRISSANSPESTLMHDITNGDDDLHFVARLGRFVREAVDGFELVASKLVSEGRHDDARMIRDWASSLTESSPWIPSWVGNPTHDIWGGFLRLRKRVAKWLRENGSMPRDDVEAGDVFDATALDRATATARYPGQGERFAAIDTGAKKNPAALAIVERIEYRGRYQWRPILLRQWVRRSGELPLDLRGKVLPEMARLILAHGCLPGWWSDGWSGHDVELVGAERGLSTTFVSTSTAYRDICAPFDSALSLERGDAVALSGCDNVEAAVAQLRAVRRAANGGVIWPEVGAEHGELAQVLLRAMAHAGIGELAGAEVDADDDVFSSDGSDRGDGCSGWDRDE